MNRLLWWIGDRMMSRLTSAGVNDLRRREGLAPVKSMFREVWRSPLLNLVAASPALCPPVPDWGEQIQVCGFFDLPGDGEPWDMPDDLAHFLDDGPPPIYLTFGSMIDFEAAPVDVMRCVVEAIGLAGCRAIVQAPWQRITGVSEQANVFRIERAPHRHLFPRCAAVVHHGGAGTTQTATLHQRPSVVVAHAADQLFWGSVLHRLQVAPAPLHRRSLTAPKLAHAISTVLTSPHLADNARRLGEAMRREDGVGRATELLERAATGWTA